MNDAPVDIAPIATLTNTRREPVDGEALTRVLHKLFYDHYWNSKFHYQYWIFDDNGSRIRPYSSPPSFIAASTALTKSPGIAPREERHGRRRIPVRAGGTILQDLALSQTITAYSCSFKYINFDYKLGSAK